LSHWISTLPRSSTPKTTRQPEVPPSLPVHCAQLAFLGHGHLQTCQSLCLSASRSRVVAGLAPLIQPHLHTMTSSHLPQPPLFASPASHPAAPRTPHTLNTKVNHAHFTLAPFPLTALPAPLSQTTRATPLHSLSCTQTKQASLGTDRDTSLCGKQRNNFEMKQVVQKTLPCTTLPPKLVQPNP